MSIDFETEHAGPSLSDLAAIEAEWPKIEADLAELDAEIEALYAADRRPNELDWRRKRRTEAQLTRAIVAVEQDIRRLQSPATPHYSADAGQGKSRLADMLAITDESVAPPPARVAA